jgi:DNA-binding response OmpR family regulator
MAIVITLLSPVVSMRRILLIDDEPAMRQVISLLLRPYLQVDTAPGVDEGVTRFQASPPNLVLIDLAMPGKNGLDGIKELRLLDPDIPIIIVTGSGDRSQIETGLEAGAQGFVEKPFDIEQLLAVINENIAA